MLNLPLSLLSDDLLVSVVEYIAKLPSKDENLCNLSLADRAFTRSCQKYIFQNLKFNSSRKIAKRLNEAKIFLHEKPLFANHIRMVELLISRNRSWVLDDYALISILQLLSKSPIPPHELHFGGHNFSGRIFYSFKIKDPILVVRRFAQSFFSQTLTILRLKECKNVPLPLFLISPRLREVSLDRVGATEQSYDKFPDSQHFGREAPPLEVLDYRNSHSLVKLMLTPPPRFNTPVVLWSNLRVLTLAPRDKEGIACLQAILNAACNTVKELYLTGTDMDECKRNIF